MLRVGCFRAMPCAFNFGPLSLMVPLLRQPLGPVSGQRICKSTRQGTLNLGKKIIAAIVPLK